MNCWLRWYLSCTATIKLSFMLVNWRTFGKWRGFHDCATVASAHCLPVDLSHLVQLKDTHTPFNGPLSGTTRVSQYQKEETNMDFTEARDSEWQWHQLGHMQVCTLLQSDNHASTPPLSFLQAGCPSCCPTNSVKALKVILLEDLLFILPNWTELAVYG